VAALAAGIFGADADEIALTHSAGEGLNSALLGMPWEPGDEVVTTTEEHPGLLIPLNLLARRQGVVTRYADVGNGGKHVAEAIASQITSRTRAIAVSHLLWSTGAVIPLQEISELARENELLVIVDAAQSAGQIPIDLHELGVDAYAMPGQKWLCGPESTGLLYIRRDRFGDILPTYTRYGQFETSGFYIPAAGAMRYEIGEFSGAAVAGQEAALHWLRDEVGFDWAHARISALGAALHQRLSRIDRVTVITPANAMAGMVNFTVEGVRPQEVTSALYERGYTIRYVDTRPCTVSARASVGWWNTEEEVSGLADAIARIAAGAGESLD
jgi:L-cysteine/cystine lyase